MTARTLNRGRKCKPSCRVRHGSNTLILGRVVIGFAHVPPQHAVRLYWQFQHISKL